MPRTYTTRPTRVVTGYNTSEDGTRTPIVQSATQAQASAQDAQHAAALSYQQQNAQYQSYIDPATGKDTRTITGGVSEADAGWKQDANGNWRYVQASAPTASGGTLGTYGGTNKGGVLSLKNTIPNYITPTPTTAPTRSIAGQQALRTKLGLTDTSTLTPHSGDGYGGNTESTQDFETRKAAIEKQNTEKMNQYLAMQEEQRKQAEHEQNLAAGLNAPTTPPPSTPGATTLGTSISSGSSPSSSGVPGSDQFTKAYQPILDALQKGDTQAAKDLVDSLAALPSEKSITDEAALNRKSIDEFSGKVLDLSTREHDLALAREQETKLHQENANANAKALFEINQALQESQQREANIQSERKNRRIAAAMGITHDTNGLDWMAREERKGQEILTAMQQSGNVMRAQYAESARSISENYRLATQQADLNYDNSKITIQKEHDDAIRELAKTVSLEKKSRTDAIKEANKNFWDKITQNDMKRAEAQKDINVETLKLIQKANEDTTNTSEKALDQLLQIKSIGITNLNPTALASLQSKLPGIDVAAILKAPTLKGIEDAKKSEVDTLTDPSSFHDPEASRVMELANDFAINLPVGSQPTFRKNIAQKLRSGDKQGAIRQIYTQAANDLTGTARTTYDQRGETVGLANAALGLVNGIIEKNGDDFRFTPAGLAKEKAKRYFGGEYDSEALAVADQFALLNTKVANAISGAAITPQEFERMKPMLPQPDEPLKNAQEKLTRLSAYSQWLNDRRIAQSLGLPEPPDPTLLPQEKEDQDNAPKRHYKADNSTIQDIINPKDSGGGDVLSWSTSVGDGTITQKFDTPIAYKVYGKNQHQGLDIDGKIGDPIPAFKGGKVVFVGEGWNNGWGNQVVVEDSSGEYCFQYSHLSQLRVKMDDLVSPLQHIGLMGNTGHVIPSNGGDGSHLDFEILQKVNGKWVAIDPETYQKQYAIHTAPSYDF